MSQAKTEEWRNVVGFEGIYEVSCFGRVRKATGYVRKSRWDQSVPGKIIRSIVSRPHGYPQVALTVDGKAYARMVHVLVADAFIGPRPIGFDVNHKDFDRENASVENLEYVSRRENIQHSIRAGRIKPSELGSKSFKLTKENVREILQLLASGERVSVIARRYDVHKSTVSHIKSGKRRQLVS